MDGIDCLLLSVLSFLLAIAPQETILPYSVWFARASLYRTLPSWLQQ
jgi:hypothetical protein